MWKTVATAMLAIGMFFAVVVLADGDAKPFSTTEPAPATQPDSSDWGGWYSIKRIIIPPDSAWRKDPHLNHPPDLYIIVKKDGTKICRASDDVKGWEVEFPKASRNNYWIDGDVNTTYTVEVWEDDWTPPDTMVVTIVNIKVLDFKSPLHEHLAEIDDPKRAITVEFEKMK